MLRHVVRLAGVALAATAAGLVVSLAAAPAEAATCSTSAGVSVVVDFHQLGGGVQTACDAGGAGKYAAAQFTEVGHTLTYVQGQAFVCQIDGAPATQCVRTPPANAYWSLWWSDGKSGKWTYASSGVGTLKVPAGGYVAFSWQKGTGQVPPGVTPTAHTSSSPSTKPASPTTSPTHPSSQAPPATDGPSTTSASSDPTTTGTGSPDPSGPSSTKPKHHHASDSASTDPTSSPSATSSDGAAAVQAGGPPDTSAPGSGSGLPGWVAPAVVAALFVAAAAVAVVRRKRAGGA